LANTHTPTDRVLIKPSISPKSRTAAQNGKSVDCFLHTRALVISNWGADSGETVTVTVEESSTGTSGWTAITGAVHTAVASWSPDSVAGYTRTMNIDLTKRLRYLRVVYTPVGSTATLFSAQIVLFNPERMAESQDVTPVSV
jgi:hypothetical protein